MKENEESQGEDFIAEFLEEEGIKFERYPSLSNLKHDTKSFRKADFYLPEYKIYIEFLGQWNNPEHRKRYKQKMAVYFKNNIPCIYLWPDNLGTLSWIFRRRLRETLLKFNKSGLLWKYELKNYWNREDVLIMIIILGSLFYLIKNMIFRIFLILIIIHKLCTDWYKLKKKLERINKSKWASNNNYNPQKEN